MRAGFLATAMTSTLFASAALAGVTKTGPEFPVNMFTAGDQLASGIALDSSGNVLVVWEDEGNADGSDHGIFGRRFAADGTPLGDDFQVNTFTTGRQGSPSLAAVSGGFVVAWQGPGQDGDGNAILAQRLDGEGARLGDEFVVDTNTTGDQGGPSVAGLADGGFVIAWTTSELPTHVAARIFDADGTARGDEFQVNDETTHDAIGSGIAADGVGGFVVVWNDFDADFALDGRARHVDGDASPGPEVDLGVGVGPFLVARPSGDFFVLWGGPSVSDSDGGILARTLSADATVLGDAFQMNSNASGWLSDPRVAFDTNGAFVTSWTNHGGLDGDGNGIFARAFNASGLPVGDDAQVNTTTQLDQDMPAIVATSADHYFTVWTDWSGHDGNTGGVYAQLMSVTPGVTLTVAHPNGGEQLHTGEAFRIRWRTIGADQLGPINVAVSTDLGAHFRPISGCQALPAKATSCLWRSPSPVVNGKALIRVSALTRRRVPVQDVSDAPFSIKPARGPHRFSPSATSKEK